MIGQLRHRVILQRRSESADPGGGISLSWVDVAELSAAATALFGAEAAQAMRLASTQSWLIRLRYRADITPADRFSFNQKILNIRSVRNIEQRGRWLECRCEEGVAG